MPTSSEFVSLCQSQVALLTQGLGAALSIVYLTEELTPGPDTQFVPVVAHPEAALHWGEAEILSFLTQIGLSSRQRWLSESARPDAMAQAIEPSADEPITLSAQSSALRPVEVLLPQQQIILPLIYQEQMMGLLLTARADRAWNEAEQRQIEQIAQTLAAGCILDWRVQWLAQDLQQQQLLEERRNDLFDDLLHQFRNPLTALRTFGKLLVKRLRPSDSNHSVAESIVRESDRLQELLKQLDVAIDLEVDDLMPLFPPNRLPAAVPTATQTQNAAEPLALPHSETRLLLGGAIDLQPHAILEVLQPLLDSAAAIAQDRQLRLETHLATQLPPVLIDVRALREVLSNLLDNALKYTPAGGDVYVGIQRSPATDPAASQQSIIIADTGPGIPSEDLQHLFERHYRGVQAATDIPGTGLGLAIARDLVQQMRGEIQLFSPAAQCGLLPPRWTGRHSGGTVAIVRLEEA